jgi:hypothetical protein
MNIGFWMSVSSILNLLNELNEKKKDYASVLWACYNQRVQYINKLNVI